MRIAKRKQNLFLVVVAGVLLTLGLPAAAFAAPQGYGYDHGFNKGQRKCEKFVNCHDARDGRWDGRGRRADRRWNYVRRDRVYYNGVNRNYLDQWRLARLRRQHARFENRRMRIRHINRTNNVRWRNR